MTDGPDRGLEQGVCGLMFYDEFIVFIFNVIGEYSDCTLLVNWQISDSKIVMKKDIRLCMLIHIRYLWSWPFLHLVIFRNVQ